MKKNVLKIASAILAISMLLSSVAFAAEVDYGKKLDEAIALYRQNSLFADKDADYLREALVELFEEDSSLFYKLVNKIYGKNDRYSKYMTLEAYEESYEHTKTMVGIGVAIGINDSGALEVSSVSVGPAYTAGIKKGDLFVAVDGVNVEGYLPAELGNLIRGEIGTSVKIEVMRGEERLTFNIKREEIRLSDVESYHVNDKVGYIKLSQFGGIYSFMEFMEVYDEFEESGINTVILDLRNNPGGNFDCLINLMDNIVPKKDVPYLLTWQANPYGMKSYLTEGYGWEFNKFVILVNRNTASAAEVMAGAMRDLGYATIVGEKTLGKGMGQIHAKLDDGDEAIITTMEIKLPLSGGYDGEGLMPDHNVAMKLTRFKLPYLTPLKSKTDASKIKTENVKAIEERLYQLGYFFAAPDDVWDAKTVNAVNSFCRDRGYVINNSVCKWDTIVKIDEATKRLEQKYVAEDKPLEYAIKLAEEYAASDKKAQCVDLSLIDFKRG